MNTLIRSLSIVAVFAPLIVGAAGARWGLELLDLGESLRQARRRQELHQFLQASIRYSEARTALAREVISQRCSLHDALEQMQQLNREWLQEMEERWPDLSRDLTTNYRQHYLKPDRCYSRLTREIKGVLHNRPEKADTVLRRLDEEYQQLRAGNQPPPEPRFTICPSAGVNSRGATSPSP